MPAAKTVVVDTDLPPLQAKPKYSAFFKFGLYNQSTFSIETDSVEEFANALANMEGSGFEALVKASKELHTYTGDYFGSAEDLVKNKLGGQPVADTQSGKKCEHGWMVYKTGEKNGKSWAAYMCPLPKGPNQCKPVWA